MRIKVFIFVVREKIKCLCKVDNKLCERDCEIGTMDYDQYDDLEFCQKVGRYGR